MHQKRKFNILTPVVWMMNHRWIMLVLAMIALSWFLFGFAVTLALSCFFLTMAFGVFTFANSMHEQNPFIGVVSMLTLIGVAIVMMLSASELNMSIFYKTFFYSTLGYAFMNLLVNPAPLRNIGSAIRKKEQELSGDPD